ncbi:MAG: 16S rRNA (adenine(1518)-N(6)/adenine(1519)-N(6))-dimethyltransferase RsmA [Nonlabens sp.]|nr:16S rRNA (adenine(1518)-N(6)/adenine(1519)-N(6))-dimethyltransferase RsmA [Nonlabens sp.]
MAKHKQANNKAYKPSDKGVTAKKFLGQHFLMDMDVAQGIANVLSYDGYKHVLEIGPGTGVLTQYILAKDIKVTAMELDRESVAYLNSNFKIEQAGLVTDKNFEVVEADFLKKDLGGMFNGEQFAIIGNFPYNISTQIVFKTIENRERIPEFGGMFQREVAERICAPHGTKTYGILSVLAQAYYDATYCFTVGPEVFNPPPKVDSGVLFLKRKENYDKLSCSYETLRTVVKLAFNQRRKTLRNSLKSMELPDDMREQELFDLRPEQISVAHFVELATAIEGLT